MDPLIALMRGKRRICAAAVLLGLATAPGLVMSAPGDFPRPAELERDFAFWERIFGEIENPSGLLHDPVNLAAIYQQVDMPGNLTRTQRSARVDALRARYRKILLHLAEHPRSRDNAEQRRVRNLWPRNTSPATFRQAAGNVRFQNGQARSFRIGYRRSGRWMPHILRALRDRDMPVELAALPHLESGFNPTANSHVGAAGMWQFMRATAQRFMRVDHLVDERLDPFRASEGAADLLAYNHRVTGTWPLALTAYNSGAGGMKRAIAQVGTRDVARILREYKAPHFKFASRNFYPAFVAVLHVRRNADRYFGPLPQDAPEADHTLELQAYYQIDDLARALSIPTASLRTLNPALSAAIWSGDKRVPTGYRLRVPEQAINQFSDATQLAAVPRYDRQRRSTHHRVRSGETLSEIAERYGMSSRQLARHNSLRSRHQLRVGQRLKIPGDQTELVAAASPRRPAPALNRAPASYRVRSGDTLSEIAERYGMHSAQLARHNGLSSRHNLKVGQRLKIPASASQIAAATPDRHPAPPPARITTYRVSSGDTLSQIAVRHGVSTNDLISSNNIKRGAVLRTGQKLRIPVSVARSHRQMPVRAYQVQSGDTLSTIAERHGVRTSWLAEVNQISDHHSVRVGQTLTLNPGSAATSTYVVRPGDTLSTIAERHGVSSRKLRALNAMRRGDLLLAGQKIKLPAGARTAPKHYRVRVGDTLSEIAQRFGLSSRELMAYNDLRNGHRIYAGQVLAVSR